MLLELVEIVFFLKKEIKSLKWLEEKKKEIKICLRRLLDVSTWVGECSVDISWSLTGTSKDNGGRM